MATYHHGNLRAALLERAVEVIDAQGVEGLSLRQIAKDLGVSHAAPARHFQSKADLLAALVKDAYLELTQHVLASAHDAGETDPIVALNLMAQQTLRWALANRAKFSVMSNPDVSRFADDALKDALSEFAAAIGAALAAAQAAGFRPAASPETMMIYAIGAARGIAGALTDGLISAILTEPSDDIDDMIKQIADQVVPLPPT